MLPVCSTCMNTGSSWSQFQCRLSRLGAPNDLEVSLQLSVGSLLEAHWC